MNCRISILILWMVTVGAVEGRTDETPFFHETFIVEETSPIPELYRPTLTLTSGGRLVCAWAAGSGFDALDTSIRLSSLSGGGWSAPVTVADEVGLAENYPLLHPGSGDRVRLFQAIFYQERRKVPPGADMAAWHLVYGDYDIEGQRRSGQFFLIPESDIVPSSPVLRLADGTTLLPATDLEARAACFLVSEDGGGYWSEAGRIQEPSGLVDPSVVELSPGYLLALLRPHELTDRERRIWRAESGDGGRNWSPPQATELLNPAAPMALLKQTNGHLVLIYNDHAGWQSPLAAAVSTDGGATWPHKRYLVTGQWDNRDPSLIQAGDGRLNLVYVYRHSRLKHVEFNEAWITEDAPVEFSGTR